MVKIVIDAGHGFDTPDKRSPVGEREWTFNDKVVRAAILKLETYKNVEVMRVDDPTGKTDIPLKVRTDLANEWKADVYVSIHHNAFTGNWDVHSGVETYTFDSKDMNSKSNQLASHVHPRIVKAMGIRDKGIKRANLHVLRETTMPAILTEGGFIDSTVDIIKLRDDSYLKAEGEAIAEGIAAYINLQTEGNTTHEINVIDEKKVNINIYKPTLASSLQSTMSVLSYLESNTANNEISTIYREKLMNGVLTDSDAIGLLFVAYEHQFLK